MSRNGSQGGEPTWPTEAQLDEGYRSNPFPSFEVWSGRLPAEEARRADELASEIDAEATEKGAEALDRALDVTMRAAAVDTGALEGLYETDEGITMTIARRAAGWQATAEAKEILPFFEAQLAALEVVMDLVTESKPLASGGLTEVALKELHRQITGAQTTYEVQTPAGLQLQELPRGEYKKLPNHVRGPDGIFFSYAPVLDTASEMQCLVEELSADAFKRAPALVQAAYSHYAFVRIHPFADGNGRLARALAPLYLLRAYRVPLVIFAEDRKQYLESLRSADQGQHQAFTDFVGWAVVGSLELALDEMRQGVPPSFSDQAERLSRLLDQHGRKEHLRAERAAIVLLDLAQAALKAVIREAQSGLGSVHLELTSSNVSVPHGFEFRPPLADIPNAIYLRAVLDGPKVLEEKKVIFVEVEAASGSSDPPRVRLSGRENFLVEAARLVPTPDARVVRRLRRWSEREISRFIEELEGVVRAEFGEPGQIPNTDGRLA